ncbi:hypothetical protein D3C80_1478950 [compost metagenome]
MIFAVFRPSCLALRPAEDMAPRHQPMIAGGKRDLVTVLRDANASRGDHLAIAGFGVAIAAIAFILEPLVGFMGKRRGGERQQQKKDRQNKAHRHGLR